MLDISTRMAETAGNRMDEELSTTENRVAEETKRRRAPAA